MKLIEQVKTKIWIKLTKHQIQAKEIVSWRKWMIWMTSNIDELNGIDENINQIKLTWMKLTRPVIVMTRMKFGNKP